MVRYSLDAGYHVTLEGILSTAHYRRLLTGLTEYHLGQTRHYYFDLSFDETVARHATRPLAAEVTADQMQDWYRPRDLLGASGEVLIGADPSLDETVKMIIDGGFPPAPVLARASPARWIS